MLLCTSSTVLSADGGVARVVYALQKTEKKKPFALTQHSVVARR